MQQENKVLGILAIVFGAIALLGSWIPIINYLSFFIGTIALILAIIGLIINRKKNENFGHYWFCYFLLLFNHRSCHSIILFQYVQ